MLPKTTMAEVWQILIASGFEPRVYGQVTLQYWIDQGWTAQEIRDHIIDDKPFPAHLRTTEIYA